eukprot:CAMPEP_0116042536 /NCGR_PEP_ID=MMETSP0321-20121206/25756_1 /TAXON_ID=163516 /ORGANISM="Leptocylindrus danicus var. danicus, Strain B650" /LENGTH=527 /DNA_ID=CAMNT_0003523047 /DNA_START=50 /DNA_END=1633 /DNA_ORIENTATION=+
MSDSIVLPGTYEQTSLIEQWHGVPRSGHSDDISLLASDNNDDRIDYIEGLLFIPGFLLCFYILWAVISLLYACFVSCPTCASSKEMTGRSDIFRLMSRVTFLSCGTVAITFVLLYLALGIPAIENAVESVQEANDDLTVLLNDALETLDDLGTVGAIAIEERDNVDAVLDSFCADSAAAGTIFGFDLTGLTSVYDESLAIMGSFQTDVLPDIREDMETGLDWAENTSDLIEFSDDVFSIIQISCIVILVLVSFLTGALLLDWFGKNPPICRTFMVWVILPVFSVLSLICMILAAIAASVAVVNADFCSGGDAPGSPSESILAILKELDIDVTSYAFLGAVYYTQNCASEYPFPFFEYKDDLDSAYASGESLLNSINAVDDETFSLVCGSDRSEITGLVGDLNNVMNSLQIIVEDVIGDNGVLSCERLSGVYTDAVEETVCRDTMQAWNWTFVVTTCLLACSLLMLTLRPFYKTMPSTSNLEKSAFEGEKEFEGKEVVLGDEDNLNSAPDAQENVEGEKVVRGDEGPP